MILNKESLENIPNEFLIFTFEMACLICEKARGLTKAQTSEQLISKLWGKTGEQACSDERKKINEQIDLIIRKAENIYCVDRSELKESGYSEIDNVEKYRESMLNKAEMYISLDKSWNYMINRLWLHRTYMLYRSDSFSQSVKMEDGRSAVVTLTPDEHKITVAYKKIDGLGTEKPIKEIDYEKDKLKYDILFDRAEPQNDDDNDDGWGQ